MEAFQGFRRLGAALAGSLALAAGGCHRSTPSAAPLVLNELMAGGASRPLASPGGAPLVDENGDPADWIELYNPLDTAVNLAGYSLTTDPDRPTDYRFPPLLLQPRSFVVLIADNRPEAGPLHVDFRLTAGGETVYLFGNNGAALVDRKTYRGMDQDSVAGRYPDGGDFFDSIYVPSPGEPNRPPGIKPPRFESEPDISPNPSNPSAVPVRFTVLNDAGVPMEVPYLEREVVADCFAGSGQVLPGRFAATEVERGPAPPDSRRDVQGKVVSVPQEAITYCVCLPTDPSQPTLRIKITARNLAGESALFSCQCVTCPKLPLAINEFVPSNQSELFDRYSHDGRLTQANVSPDWIEIYNFGEEEISLAGVKLVGGGTYQDLVDPNPPNPPDLFLWSFGDVGLQRLGPKQFLRILADNDNPYDGNGNPSYRTYVKAGNPLPADPAGGYRSTNFRLSADASDTFVLLDELGNVIDRADFNFEDPTNPSQPRPEIHNRAFGRLPDAAEGKRPLVFNQGGQPDHGELLCPTPEAPNRKDCGAGQSALRAAVGAPTWNIGARRGVSTPGVCECRYDVLPHFDKALYNEPRCPGPGGGVQVLAFLSIDQDTAAADTEENFSFEVELSFRAGDAESVVLRRGMLELFVREPTVGELRQFTPESVFGTRMFVVDASLPAQPGGTLVTYSLRARDLELPRSGGDPELPAWVDFNETTAPDVSFRFKSGYQRPNVVINEVFPSADPGGPPLHYRGPQGITLPQMDYLELYNDSSSPADLSGMLLHDEEQPPAAHPWGPVRQFVIPPETVLAPHGFLTIFFPREGEEDLVPEDALAVTAPAFPGGETLALDDCKEALYLQGADPDGNCVVSRARWDTTTSQQSCPAGVSLGVFPDGKPSEPFNLSQREVPTPGASNCGGRQPKFSVPPLHFLAQGGPSICPDQDVNVRIEAGVLIDAFAGVLLPPTIPGNPGGIREAKLLVTKGSTRSEVRMTVLGLSDPSVPDACWVQAKLTGNILPPQPAVTVYQVQVEDAFGNILRSEELSYGVAGSKPPVVINEAMADNQRTLADDRGQFVPWIEIINRGSAAVDLGGMFLTEDASQPRKWQFPRTAATQLPPRGCLIVFVDGGDPSNPSGLHANFTLAASGPADVFLLDRPEGGTCVIDAFHYDFTGLGPDTSIGRIPDGTGAPAPLPAPSPCRPSVEPGFLRGDTTGDGRVGTSDLSWFFQIVFFDRQPAPGCRKVLDINDDGKIGVEDGIYLGNFLFLDGPTIPPPFPEEGIDPTPDDLPCP